MNIEAKGEFADASFGARFRRLRRALGSKQSVMSASGLCCTDAAISHWETGKRLPRARSMKRVLDAFAKLGATQVDIAMLYAAWSFERSARQAGTPRGQPESAAL